MMNHSGPLPTQGSIDLSAEPADEQITQRLPRQADDDVTQPLVSPTVSRLVEEIALTALRPGDQVRIRTAHSVYILTITNPALPVGYLTGGRLGSVPVRACPVPLPLHDETGERNNTLRCGERVVFLLETRDGVLYFFPSQITALVYRKAGGEGEGAASGRRPCSV